MEESGTEVALPCVSQRFSGCSNGSLISRVQTWVGRLTSSPADPSTPLRFAQGDRKREPPVELPLRQLRERV